MTERELERASRALPAEVDLAQPPSLARREPRFGKCAHDLVGESALLVRERRRGAFPSQTSADVVVESRLRARYLIRASMQVEHLVKQGLEVALVDPRKVPGRVAGRMGLRIWTVEELEAAWAKNRKNQERRKRRMAAELAAWRAGAQRRE